MRTSCLIGCVMVLAALGGACDQSCPEGRVRYGAKCVRVADAGGDPDVSTGEGDSATPDAAEPRRDGDASTPCEPNVCGGCANIDAPERLGQACDAGLGDCKVPGAWVCEGKDALKCSGTPKEGGTEACGGGDEDCDGKVDESSLAEPASGATFWFADCDGDGFAPQGAVSARTCVAPPSADTACNTEAASWTSKSPQANADCADQDPKAFPGQTLYSGSPIAGTIDDYDFDCDGEQQPTFAFPGLNTGSASGCDSHAIDWILAIDAERCFDHTTGYAAACGQLFPTLNAGFASDGSRIECGETGTVCKWAYNAPLTCR